MDQITFCTDYTESYNCIEASKLPPFYLYRDDRHKMKQRGGGGGGREGWRSFTLAILFQFCMIKMLPF